MHGGENQNLLSELPRISRAVGFLFLDSFLLITSARSLSVFGLLAG